MEEQRKKKKPRRVGVEAMVYLRPSHRSSLTGSSLSLVGGDGLGARLLLSLLGGSLGGLGLGLGLGGGSCRYMYVCQGGEMERMEGITGHIPFLSLVAAAALLRSFTSL